MEDALVDEMHMYIMYIADPLSGFLLSITSKHMRRSWLRMRATRPDHVLQPRAVPDFLAHLARDGRAGLVRDPWNGEDQKRFPLIRLFQCYGTVRQLEWAAAHYVHLPFRGAENALLVALTCGTPLWADCFGLGSRDASRPEERVPTVSLLAKNEALVRELLGTHHLWRVEAAIFLYFLAYRDYEGMEMILRLEHDLDRPVFVSSLQWLLPLHDDNDKDPPDVFLRTLATTVLRHRWEVRSAYLASDLLSLAFGHRDRKLVRWLMAKNCPGTELIRNGLIWCPTHGDHQVHTLEFCGKHILAFGPDDRTPIKEGGMNVQ